MLLVVGFVFIKQRRELAHKRTMLACFGVSFVFLLSYLFYHFVVKDGSPTRFPQSAPKPARFTYLAVLLTHTILAAAVPFLATITIYLGLKDRRRAHRRLARWTFPIWLYVSITGVIVYLMLYQMYPPEG